MQMRNANRIWISGLCLFLASRFYDRCVEFAKLNNKHRLSMSTNTKTS
jgi:hypothetical protein